MAHTKAQGSTRQQGNRPGKHRGVKIFDGQVVSAGTIIVRQLGAVIRAGNNVGMGKDFTLFAKMPGEVKYYNLTKTKKAVKVVASITEKADS